MTSLPRFLFALLALLIFTPVLQAQEASTVPTHQVPSALKDWESWATWDDVDLNCPTTYDDPTTHLCSWPSVLNLAVVATGAQFDFNVTVYADSWVNLPGNADHWPRQVKANGAAIAVLPYNRVPTVHLAAGTYHLEGTFSWSAIPQSLDLPREIGMLKLVVEGKPVEAPTWLGDSSLLLQAQPVAAVGKNSLGLKVYRLLQDGIPLVLQTEIELSVSGASREEKLPGLLPEGWQLSAVESPLPVAVDEQGRAKVQVRAGRWLLQLSAFRSLPLASLNYKEGVKPAVARELVGFQADPSFRLVEIRGVSPVDVSQTAYPQMWAQNPVYQWETDQPFQIVELLRGAGQQKPSGLAIRRTLWLRESGLDFTYLDNLSGQAQRIWRLDAASHNQLGSLKSSGEGQLITSNPATDALGVELRSSNLSLEATGQIDSIYRFPATGWETTADSLTYRLVLPPGWRTFAVFGPDWVSGDWLTSWTLLDLFYLCLFSLAVFRLWGWKPGLFALLAFGLSYHEPDVPHFAWMFVLVPIALLRLVPSGSYRSGLRALYYLAFSLLIFSLIPFVVGQLQQALFPQLESLEGYSSSFARATISQPINANPSDAPSSPVPQTELDSSEQKTHAFRSLGRQKTIIQTLNSVNVPQSPNLAFDAKARIQTGPGLPNWQWRDLSFGWSGPVDPKEEVTPILLPPGVTRPLSVLRVVLIIWLVFLLLDKAPFRFLSFGTVKSRALLLPVALLFSFGSDRVQADIPDRGTLQVLHDRLTKASNAYPHAADIAQVDLTLRGRNLQMMAEVHAAFRTAIPLPGRLPVWSPIAVSIDGQPVPALRREDGFLWIVIPGGVHRVLVAGLLPQASDWDWTFSLAPHQVTIDAPDWTYTGLRANGVPESQIFFSPKQKLVNNPSEYARQNLHTLAMVNRVIEIGLIWQVHNTVTRVTPAGQAISLSIPLLAGERILTADLVPKDGIVPVSLGAQDESFSWESELTPIDHLELTSHATDTWVEHWTLVASPVWNVKLSGLPPVYEDTSGNLNPSWHPWPGEGVGLQISRPVAAAGSTLTISQINYVQNEGVRQQSGALTISLQCSVAADFSIELPAGADVTSLSVAGQERPARRTGDRVTVPLQTGEQQISLNWTTDEPSHQISRVPPLRFFDEANRPVGSTNINETINMPEHDWILWSQGPIRGPAVRLWIVLVLTILLAAILCRIPRSPLKFWDWALLGVGLTQVDFPAGALVIGWLFLLSWRGHPWFQKIPNAGRIVVQVVLVIATIGAVISLVAVVTQGLLGSPRNFIEGNGSYDHSLIWFKDAVPSTLPRPTVLAISIWWYRLLMLAWAFWLALALLDWLRWGWRNFISGRPAGPQGETGAISQLPRS